MRSIKFKIDVPALKAKFQRLLSFFNGSKPFRYGFLFLCINFLLSNILPAYSYLSLTASDIFTLRIWKFFTGIFFEPNIFIFFWSVISLYQFLTYVEPVWGLLEILKYIAIVQSVTTVFISIVYLFLFACCGFLNVFFYYPICGFPTFGTSSLIALKQFLPDSVIITTPYGRLKNAHLPVTALITSILFWLLGIMRGVVCLQILFGVQISWTYLRFIRRTPDSDSTFGDESEHFTWASLFPRRLQPLANIIGNLFFRILLSLKICKEELELNAFETVNSTILPMSEARDAERKRQKALRMLNERLTDVMTVGQENSEMHNQNSTDELNLAANPISESQTVSEITKNEIGNTL